MSDQRDRRFVQASIDSGLSSLGGDPRLAQRIMGLERKERNVKKKLSAGVILVIALMLATTSVAFAMSNGFGLLDFFGGRRGRVEIPDDAAQYIEHDLKTVECEHATVVFREAVYDGKTCRMVYDVIPKQKDMLLFDCPMDDSWYGLTHLNADRDAMLADGRTVLDAYYEGGYASAWEVDIDLNDPTEQEAIDQYGGLGGVLNEETGVYTGTLEIPFDAIRAERTVAVYVRLLPLTDVSDEFSYDYDRAEIAAMEYHFRAAVSGELSTRS